MIDMSWPAAARTVGAYGLLIMATAQTESVAVPVLGAALALGWIFLPAVLEVEKT